MTQKIALINLVQFYKILELNLDQIIQTISPTWAFYKLFSNRNLNPLHQTKTDLNQNSKSKIINLTSFSTIYKKIKMLMPKYKKQILTNKIKNDVIQKNLRISCLNTRHRLRLSKARFRVITNQNPKLKVTSSQDMCLKWRMLI